MGTGNIKNALKPTTAPAGNVITIPNDASVDVDADGLPDTTEDPDLDGLVSPTETDNDNIKDGDESKIGTDPLDANSLFRVYPITLENGDFQISWPSAPSATFTIRSSTDLTDWPTVVANGITASAGSSTSYNLDTPSGPRKFYRVKLE